MAPDDLIARADAWLANYSAECFPTKLVTALRDALVASKNLILSNRAVIELLAEQKNAADAEVARLRGELHELRQPCGNFDLYTHEHCERCDRANDAAKGPVDAS